MKYLLAIMAVATLILLGLGFTGNTCYGAHPYDSVCRVLTKESGGSGTLINNVEGQYGVVLCVKHVTSRPGEWVSCTWGNTVCEGICWKVYSNSDMCLLLVASPPGLRPVQVALPDPANEPFVLAGFPSYSRGKLHVQQGTFRGVGRNEPNSDITHMLDRKFVLSYPAEQRMSLLANFKYDTLFTNCAPWSGMSGGACFDQRGCVVGTVATAHPSIVRGQWGGVTSGEGLIRLTGVGAATPTQDWVDTLMETLGL